MKVKLGIIGKERIVEWEAERIMGVDVTNMHYTCMDLSQ